MDEHCSSFERQTYRCRTKGFIYQIKHCSARRCIAEKTEVCLKTEDLQQGLRVSRHLFRTVASVEENEPLDDDWDEDDEGEWVIA